MSTIKAPFNFVPLSDTVYSPDWADLISHDIPFEDGLSGMIELEITAESPIFIRDGQGKDKKTATTSSSNINGKFFLPATSLKGMTRNVLEIMSFGKMHLDKKAMFAQRDWDNEKIYPLKKEQTKFLCGWLKPTKDGYEIIDCGKPFRIGHDRIDEYLKKDLFTQYFSAEGGFDLTKEYKYNEIKYDPKTAAFKYALLKDYNLSDLTFSKDERHNNALQNRLKYDKDGSIYGTIVVTGQPDQWINPRPKTLTKKAGKFYDFVFRTPDSDAKRYQLSETDFDHFEFIYAGTNDWKFAQKRLNKEGIPVFFKRDEKTKKIEHFGLAFLYKLPYENSPYDLLGRDHRENACCKPDLAECLFGYSEGENGRSFSLKGRVQFSPAFPEEKDPIEGEEISLILSSPKASYYPIYIHQKKGSSEYSTYRNGTLAGWKRYLLRENTWQKSVKGDTQNTQIKPLKTGAKFTGRVRFHNLKKTELGALLSALTFHNTPGCFHQIGQGKPYGFGKIHIKAKLLNLSEKDDLEGQEDFLMALFQKSITHHVNDWAICPEIIQLFTLASEEVKKENSKNFEYMNIDVKNKEKNDFVNAKNRNEFFDKYSDLQGKIKMPNNLLEKYGAQLEEAEIKRKAGIELAQKKEYELKLAQEKAEQEAALKKALEEQNKRYTERIEAGLSFLSELNEKREYKVKDFKGAKNRIDQWLKKTKLETIPENQYSLLKTTIERLYASPDKKEKRDWDNYESKNIWIPIRNWLGENYSKTLFKQLTSV